MRLSGLTALLLCASLGACSDARAPLEIPNLRYELDAHWPEPTSYPGVGQGRILITNNAEDTVSILDLDRIAEPDFGELARVPVGLVPAEPEGPHHAAIDPGGEFYYVGISNFVPAGGSGPHGAHGNGTADGHVLKIRASDNMQVAQVRVDRNPGDLVASADGKTLYVTHFDLLRITEVAALGGPERDMDARLAIIDAETMTRRAMVPVCAAPHGLKPSPDGARVYISCYSDEVAVVDVSREDYPVTRVKVAQDAGGPLNARHEPFAVNVHPLTGEAWVSSLRSGFVQVLNPTTLTIDRRVRVGGNPVFGCFSSDGSLLYMPHQLDDRISVIDTEAASVLRTIPLPASDCLNVHWMELTPDERHGLVLCEGDHIGPGSLLVLDMATEQTIRVVEVGAFPDYLGILRRHGP